MNWTGKVSLFAAAAMLFVSPALMAQGMRHGASGRTINQRQVNQQKRIRQGVASGELTKKEVKQLEKRQTSINRQEQRFRESGNGLNARERAILTHRQNQASKKIYRQKHDNQDRN